MRLRVSRRAALVALVGSGWEKERSLVDRMYIILAQGILSFYFRRLRLSLSLSLNLSLSLSHRPNLSFNLSPRLSHSLIVIMKETERANEKKEKQQKKQKNKKQQKKKQEEKRKKNMELDSRKVASKRP